MSDGRPSRWDFAPTELADGRRTVAIDDRLVIDYRRPDWIFWDVGLTLVYPSGSLICAELHEAFPTQHWDPEDVVAALVVAAEGRHLRWPVGLDGDARVARAWAALLGLATPDGELILARCLERTDLYREFDPAAPSVLGDLIEKGIRLGVISNSDGTLRDELAHFGIAHYFSIVIDSHHVGAEKPDRAIFETALREAAVDPDDAWHIGDGLLNDYLGSSTVGIHPVLLDRYTRYGPAAPICAIRDLTEFGEASALKPRPTSDTQP